MPAYTFLMALAALVTIVGMLIHLTQRGRRVGFRTDAQILDVYILMAMIQVVTMQQSKLRLYTVNSMEVH